MLQLFSSKKKKFMTLKVDINAPEYDGEGKLIHNEEELDDETNSRLESQFNAYLLEEEVMD